MLYQHLPLWSALAGSGVSDISPSDSISAKKGQMVALISMKSQQAISVPMLLCGESDKRNLSHSEIVPREYTDRLNSQI